MSKALLARLRKLEAKSKPKGLPAFLISIYADDQPGPMIGIQPSQGAMLLPLPLETQPAFIDRALGIVGTGFAFAVYPEPEIDPEAPQEGRTDDFEGWREDSGPRHAFAPLSLAAWHGEQDSQDDA